MKEKGAAKLYAWLGILAVGIVIGLYALIQVLTKGHGETLGVNDQVPWGLFLVAFAFFIGISGGATVIGFVAHVFGRDDYKPLGLPALLMGLLSLVAAMAFIALDVGNVTRMMLIPWALNNSSSVFLVTSFTYYIFGLILVAGLYYTVKLLRQGASDRDRKLSKLFAVAAFPVALWVLHAEGALFGVVKAREYWNTPLLPIHFAVAALVTGTAVMLLVALVTSSAGRKPLVSSKTLGHMGKLLACFVAVTLLFDFFDALVMNYSETPEGTELWALLSGNFFGLYALNIGGLIVSLVILLLPGGRSTRGLFLASAIAVLATAAYRYNLVIVGQSASLWEGQVGQAVSYSPTGTEVSVVIGVLALVLFAYTILVRILPAGNQGALRERAETAERQLASSARSG